MIAEFGGWGLVFWSWLAGRFCGGCLCMMVVVVFCGFAWFGVFAVGHRCCCLLF